GGKMTSIRTIPVIIAILCFSAVPDVHAEATPITLGVTTRTGTTGLPFVIAEEKGFFKNEGINGIIVVMQNQVVVNGVVARNVDYGGDALDLICRRRRCLSLRIRVCGRRRSVASVSA